MFFFFFLNYGYYQSFKLQKHRLMSSYLVCECVASSGPTEAWCGDSVFSPTEGSQPRTSQAA